MRSTLQATPGAGSDSRPSIDSRRMVARRVDEIAEVVDWKRAIWRDGIRATPTDVSLSARNTASLVTPVRRCTVAISLSLALCEVRWAPRGLPFALTEYAHVPCACSEAVQLSTIESLMTAAACLLSLALKPSPIPAAGDAGPPPKGDSTACEGDPPERGGAEGPKCTKPAGKTEGGRANPGVEHAERGEDRDEMGDGVPEPRGTHREKPNPGEAARSASARLPSTHASFRARSKTRKAEAASRQPAPHE